MLHWVQQKTEIMEFRRQQEMSPPIEGCNVLVLDLDGVVADWRQGFLRWLRGTYGNLYPTEPDPERSLSLDIDMGWSYSTYADLKAQFEREGGFSILPPFLSTLQLVREWRASDPSNRLVVTTARTTAIPRVWYDTYNWLKSYAILPDRLYFTADGRIKITLELATRNKDVVLMDDNPDIHLRTSQNQIRMLVPARGYNWEIVPDPPRLNKANDPYAMWVNNPSVMPGGHS
jgi:hypothetical protein